MTWIVQGILSFIIAISFAIIFNAPRKKLIAAGLVGMSGWLIFSGFTLVSGDSIQASFAGAFIVALAAHILSKRFRMPMIIFSVPGIILLVPGGLAYNAMRNIVENDYLTAISYASKAFMTSGAIAMGLVFAEVLMQLIFRYLRRKKTASQNV
ncbi:threonine/serine exporter family protein [Paenisporosarcina quisquiliarum]|uniref:Threonine/serine exporter family protein n=1 Tax=Paenisporosarcina quisquiliarum TaxID=365346 RepID=A0A9X3LHG2_9BACL|nr:threonine/serine exporter family protein [Paenisporosarcina quisquiliarum]MCZ8538043.1 threonine/serine exporter family protein [Paenisporosarcina quisquiliarum]